ncbi:hypothetical protein [Streptacidiphilus sp. PAMC 29251]
MTAIDTTWFDITQTNRAVRELIERTDNPRHRHLLRAYDRHRNLEHAGRIEEIFAPEMTVEHPVYRFHMGPAVQLEGREQVEAVYRYWAQTNQSAFYIVSETIAVGDWLVVSSTLGYQQVLGSDLAAGGFEVDDPEAMYLRKGRVAMVWPYDERCRLIGENVWEFDDSERELIKLDPADVLTTERAAELLAPLIEPLPPFDESLLPSTEQPL